MGYYLMPQAIGHELTLVAREAARVFVKAHGYPTGQLGMEIDETRRVIRVTDKTREITEMFTFAELGFL
jgi:hypothetical protein